MVVWKTIKKAINKEPVTSVSLLFTFVAIVLINLGVIKPLYVEIQLSKMSLLSSTITQVTSISLVSILFFVAIMLLLVLIIRLRK